jgi:uncharacterized protein YjbJ (UPF0337 family)
MAKAVFGFGQVAGNARSHIAKCSRNGAQIEPRFARQLRLASSSEPILPLVPSLLLSSPKTFNAYQNMNKLQIKGNWNVTKGKLKQKFAQLRDNDLQYAEGMEDELIGRIQKRLGKSKEEVEKLLEECSCESV